jgi:O-antigen/teichoic acid export membrane protein
MLVVLARLGTTEVVGRFALALALTAPVIMFANLQLRGVLATDARHEYGFSRYLSLRLITTALALLAMATIAHLATDHLTAFLVVLAVGVGKAFEAISDVMYGLFQKHERMATISRSLMMKGPLALLALGLVFGATGSLLAGVLAIALAKGLVLLLYDLPGAMSLRGGDKLDQASPMATAILKLAWLSLPLGIVMLLLSLNSNIPRYFISHQLGDGDLGIFAALASVMLAGNMAIGALGQSASPRLSRSYAQRDFRAFAILLLKLVAIGAMIGAAGLLAGLIAGRLILGLLFGAVYAEHNDLFVWLMAVAAVAYIASFLGYGMTAARHFRPQIVVAGLATATLTSACYFLVPEYGLYGAAWAALLCGAVQLLGSLGVIGYALGSKPSKGIT